MTPDEIIDRLESDGILTRVPEFEWHPGIPSRNRICRAVFGEGSGMLLKVSHLTALRLVLVEETTPDWMPIRTLVMIADDAGIALVGTIVDEAHRRWARGAAMV